MIRSFPTRAFQSRGLLLRCPRNAWTLFLQSTLTGGDLQILFDPSPHALVFTSPFYNLLHFTVYFSSLVRVYKPLFEKIHTEVFSILLGSIFPSLFFLLYICRVRFVIIATRFHTLGPGIYSYNR